MRVFSSGQVRTLWDKSHRQLDRLGDVETGAGRIFKLSNAYMISNFGYL